MAAGGGSPKSNQEFFNLGAGILPDVSDMRRDVSDSENLIPPSGGRADEVETRGGVRYYDSLDPSGSGGAVVFNCYPSEAAGQSDNIGLQVISFIVLHGSGKVMASNFMASRQATDSIFFDNGNNPYGD